MFFTLLAVLITTVLLFDYVRKKRRNDMTANLPGPRAYPLFGNSLMYVNKSPEDIMNFILNNKSKYGTLYRVWVFNQLAVFSSNPKDIEIILSSPKYITKNRLYDFLHVWLGTGLLLSSDQKWFTRRKIITPTFHFKILEQFIDIFEQQSTILVDILKKHSTGEAFNIHPYITRSTLDIICETAMGTKVHAQTDPDCEYVRAVSQIIDVLSRRFINVFMRLDWVFTIFGRAEKKRQGDALKILHKFTERVIEERRHNLKEKLKTETGDDENDIIGAKKKMAFLDVLLLSKVDGKSLTNEDIREEVDTFMFEGHDTTTAGICFTLYLISRHADVQNKIYEEIVEVIGEDRKKQVSYRELQDLKYLECVIKESLRLYPPVPLIGRLFKEDVDINGKIIPAGTNYTVGLYVMFRDPKIFPEPEKFKPERHFTEATTETTNPYAFIPFSAGPRNCIGQKFAMMEMKSVISKILRNYELLPVGPEPKPKMNLVLRSSNGIHLGLRER